jgi:hypothetical protein
MQTYRMAVKIQDPATGRTRTEYTRHLTEDEVPAAREIARQGARFGEVRGIKVVAEH